MDTRGKRLEKKVTETLRVCSPTSIRCSGEPDTAQLLVYGQENRVQLPRPQSSLIGSRTKHPGIRFYQLTASEASVKAHCFPSLPRGYLSSLGKQRHTEGGGAEERERRKGSGREVNFNVTEYLPKRDLLI